MGSTVSDLTKRLHGFMAEGGPSRFQTPGWFSQGQADLRCGLCGHLGTTVLRKHYMSSGDTYGGRVYHYWAAACSSCESVVSLADMADETRNAYQKWDEDRELGCPDCDESSVDQFLVLANSRKVGSHCVAVVDTNGVWIRPVSDTNEGALTRSQSWLSGEERMLQPLDVVEATFGSPVGRAYQPEDMENPDEWLPAASTDPPTSIGAWLDRTVDHHADFITRGRSDRIPEAEVAAEPLRHSLALVEPKVSEWCVRRTMRGGRQIRVSFSLTGVVGVDGKQIAFDLSVTDPVWEERVRDVADGEFRCFTSKELGVPADAKIYFTLSLGEPFRGDHYKLVAAVIVPELDTE